MSSRLSLAKFAVVLTFVVTPALGVAAVATADGGSVTGGGASHSAVADGPGTNGTQGGAVPTPSPTTSKDTTGWDSVQGGEDAVPTPSPTTSKDTTGWDKVQGGEEATPTPSPSTSKDTTGWD
ncbi:hypothetical protein [Streptomyces sp. NPDC089919]|uniref:hypothetical protein n=1 Tax=Streptomyces sp. NPDC089919 TaxID=3155188 RepID=UPI00342B39D4